MNFLTPEAAIARILECLSTLRPHTQQDAVLRLYVTRFVNDVLDYCHREDFPETLVYTAAEILAKWIDELETAGNAAPLKRLRQNDTEFEFAVTATSAADSLYESCMVKMHPKLNLYRKLVKYQ